MAFTGPVGQLMKAQGAGGPHPARVGDNPVTDDKGFLLPHVRTFSALYNLFSKTYSYRWDEAIRAGRENAQAMHRDAYLRALEQERLMPLTGWNWEVVADPDEDDLVNPKDPGSTDREEVRKQLKVIVNRTPGLMDLRRYLGLSLWFGRYGSQLRWDRADVLGQTRWTVGGHLPIDGDKIAFDWDGTPGVMIRPGDTGSWPDVRTWDGGSKLAMLSTPAVRQRFIVSRFFIEDGDYWDPQAAGRVNGVGYRDFCYWAWWLRDEMLSWLVDFMQKVGNLGLLLFYYEEGNPTSKTDAETAAKNASGQSALAVPIPKGSKDKATARVELIPANVAGATFLKEIVGDYFERHIERLIVGQALSTGGEGNGELGGTGRADFAKDTKYHLLRWDARKQEETFTTDLIAPMLGLNFPGCKWRYKWKYAVPDPDAAAKAEAISKGVKIGLTVKTDEAREALGLTKPDDDDEVIGGQPQGDPNDPNQPGGGAGGPHPLPDGDDPATGAGGPQQYQAGAGVWLYAGTHAPAGGVTIGGQKFAGGEFIPAEIMAKATDAEKATVGGAGGTDKARPVNAHDDAKQAWRKLFGDDPTGPAVRGLAGLPASVPATVRTYDTPRHGTMVEVTGEGDGYRARRMFYRDKEGSLVCVNHGVTADPGSAFRGRGLDIFARQVEALRRAGVERIETTAGGDGADAKKDGGYNGYYTLPRFGYDGELDHEQFGRLPAAVREAMGDRRDLRTLFDDVPGGREAWRAVGDEIKVRFDLAPWSRSSKALEMYLDDRKGAGRPRPYQAGRVLTYEARHAPEGGVTVGGKHFAGGEFIPAEVMEKATDEERAAVEGGGGTDQEEEEAEDWDTETERLLAELDKTHEAEDAGVEAARNQQDDRQRKARDREDADLESRRDGEDAARSEVRGKEDAGIEAARRRADDKLAADRGKEDDRRCRRRESEDDRLASRRDREDERLEAKFDREEEKVDEAWEADRIDEAAYHAALADILTRKRAEEARLKAEREKQDAEAEAHRSAEDEATAAARDAEDEAVESAREKEDGELAARREREDDDLESARRTEDDETKARREQQDAADIAARDAEDADRETGRQSAREAVEGRRGAGGPHPG